jgi:acyl-coenzyme A synthetase/AMP-(fatty) acid ligase
VIYSGGELSFGELSNLIINLAEKLLRAGVKTGDIVAAELPLHLDFIAIHAINLVGATSCSVLGLAKIPENLDETWLLSDGNSNLTYRPEGRIVVTFAELSEAIPTSNWREIRAQIAPSGSSAALLMYTSGTTAAPKAIVVSNELLSEILDQTVKISDFSKSQMSLIYFSRLGISTLLFQIARAMPAMISTPTNQVAHSVASRGRTQQMIGSPAQILSFINYLETSNKTLSSLDSVFLTGGPAGPGLFEAIKVHFPQAEVEIWYGSNEAGRITSLNVGENFRPGMVGEPLDGVELEILNEHGNPVEVGLTGIIRVKTMQQASYYHNDISQTAISFRGGWFYPGDLGYFDDDNLVLNGRTSDLINAGGHKVNPTQVEAVVCSLKGITDCAGVEVNVSNGITQFALAIVGPELIDTVKLDKLLRSRFPKEHPTIFAQVAQLPRNKNGKVNRQALREWFQKQI